MSDRVTKKLVKAFNEMDAFLVMVNAIDPQLPTIRVFLESIQDKPHFVVINKVDAVTVVRAQEIIDELKTTAPVILASVVDRRGIGGVKQEIHKLPHGKIAVLGIFNAGKTSLINLLTGDNAVVSDIPGTTLVLTPHVYGDWTLVDTVGQVTDFNCPLMFSIDLSGCTTTRAKIERCFSEESGGLLATTGDTNIYESIKRAIALLQRQIASGNKLVILGAGASALVAKEMAGQAQETGTPVMVFTNDFATHQPISFAKGLGEDDLAMSSYAVRAVNKGDVVIGISASGGTAFVHEAMRMAQDKEAYTIAITENADTPIGKYADIIIKSNAKPEGASSSKIQTAHLVIGHTLMIVLADERGLNAEDCVKNMLPEKAPNKLMGIK